MPAGTQSVNYYATLYFREFINGGFYCNTTLSLSSPSISQNVAVSTGTGDGDFDRISAILAAVPQLHYICVDVANGYSEHFVHFVKDVRQKFPSHTIMVSRCRPLNYSMWGRKGDGCSRVNISLISKE